MIKETTPIVEKVSPEKGPPPIGTDNLSLIQKLEKQVERLTLERNMAIQERDHALEDRDRLWTAIWNLRDDMLGFAKGLLCGNR